MFDSPTARVVSETSDTVAIYAPVNPRGDGKPPGPLVITFAHGTSRLDGLRFWQDLNLHRAGVSALGLMFRQPHWFTKPEMARLLPSLLPIIARHRPAPIVTWGFSQGALPALMHGRALGAGRSFAFSPPHSVDPALFRSFDDRPPRYFDPRQHTGFRVQEADLAPEIVLFYDPLFTCDLEHARRIEALSPRVRRVVVTGARHYSITTVLATPASSEDFIDLMLHEPVDSFARAARGLVRKGRHLSPDYLQELSATLMQQRREKLALQMARRAFALQPDNARRRIHLHKLEGKAAIA